MIILGGKKHIKGELIILKRSVHVHVEMVQVSISDGILEGEELDNVLGGTYISFKGIPYAAPPVGDLRFQAPQPVQPWDGVRSAKAHGPICTQFDIVFSKGTDASSEDCLYLNVYTPNLKPNNPLPVMFWIHGGGFISGSGNSSYFGPDFLVKQNVVLVTINYRLEVVGFLCLDTKEVPGNAGMKDQVAAMRWVQKNIRQFGGDPDNVTIFGESAGAASVAFHLISPMAKGLFNRAILQSGHNLRHLSIHFEPRLRAEVIARDLGKCTKDDYELYEFFKSQPIEKLIQIAAHVVVEEEAGIGLDLGLHIADEKEFDGIERYFYGNVHERLHNGVHEGVDIMIGYTTDEGLLFLPFLPKENTFEKFNKFVQRFVPAYLLLKCPVIEHPEIGKKIKQHYFGDEIVSGDNVRTLCKYLGTDLVTYDVIKYANICVQNNKTKLFLYQFDMYSERNIWADFFSGDYVKGKRVCHCDDLVYLFNTHQLPVDLHAESINFIEKATTLWTNFAKYGDPTPTDRLGVKWPAFDSEKQKFLIIGNELALSSHPEKKDFEFWEEIHQQYLKE